MSRNIPARYVSGYLFGKPDAEPGDEVTGQSHAWVEYWTGHGSRDFPPRTLLSAPG